MASVCDESKKNLEREIGTNWLNFDAFKQIRAIIKSYDDPEIILSLPNWCPQNIVNLECSKQDQSSSGKESEKPRYQEENKLILPSVAPINELEKRYKNILIKYKEYEEIMGAFIKDVSEYIDLDANERDLYNVGELFDRFESIRNQFRLVQKDGSILCYNYQKEAGVTIDKKCADTTVNHILTINTKSGVKFEKFIFVAILLKAHKETFKYEKSVSESLARLEVEIEEMPNWYSLDTEVLSDYSD